MQISAVQFGTLPPCSLVYDNSTANYTPATVKNGTLPPCSLVYDTSTAAYSPNHELSQTIAAVQFGTLPPPHIRQSQTYPSVTTRAAMLTGLIIIWK